MAATRMTADIAPQELLDKLPDPAAIQFWVGPGGHLLHYPIGNGDQNFFVVERNPAPWPARSACPFHTLPRKPPCASFPNCSG